MIPMKKYVFPLLFAVLCVFVVPGCQGTRTIDPAGVYHGDQVAFTANNELRLIHEAIYSLLEIERVNRSTVPAAVSKAADQVRLHVKQVEQTALGVIDVYKANPTPENHDKVLASLDAVRLLLANLNAPLVSPSKTIP